MAVKKDDGGDKKSGKQDLNGKAAPDRPGGPQGDFSVTTADNEEEIKQFLHHQYNQKLDGKPPEKEPKYASIPEAKDGENAAEQSRKKFAKNAEKQTTAAVEPDTQLPQAVQEADPQANAQVLPQMFQQLSKVMSIMKAGGGGGGQQQQQQQQSQQQGQQQGDQGQSETNAGIKENLTIALSRSLASLARKYSFKQTIDTFNTCLANDSISKLDREFQPVIRNALGNLIQNAIDNGETNLTIYTPPKVTYGSNTPSPIVTYSQVPDYSTKQYYYSVSDYNPGYIEWNDLSGNSYYIERTQTDYPFETLSDEITYGMQSGLEIDLDPYVANQNLTTPKLNEILRKYNDEGASLGKENSAGKNNNNNNNKGGGGGGAGNLLGMLQQAINMVKQDQLPQSVLNQDSVNKSLDKYQDNMTLIKRMKKESEKAADPTSSLQGLMGGGMPMNLQSMMSQVSGAMKSSGSSQGSQNSVQDLLKNITNKNDFTQK